MATKEVLYLGAGQSEEEPSITVEMFQFKTQTDRSEFIQDVKVQWPEAHIAIATDGDEPMPYILAVRLEA